MTKTASQGQVLRGLLSRPEAAEYLSISTDTLDRLRAAGRLYAIPIGLGQKKPKLGYRPADLEAYLESLCVSSNSNIPPDGTSNGERAESRSASQLARRIRARQRASSLSSG